MALKKTITTYAGVPADYLKINEVYLNYREKVAKIIISVFYNQETRESNLGFIEQKIIEINGPLATDEEKGENKFAIFEDTKKDIRATAYDYIKSLDEYKDARDV